MIVKLVRDDLDKEVQKEVELGEEATVKMLLETEGIASEEVLASIDETVVSKNKELSEGDSVRVFDVIAGG